ncbi:serine hydrolase [Massilia sp. CCM 9210]|uniref:serine hydrolase n=1 Tax=Massilia scottii TaxID=3057166 RepID=UPI002796B2A4|nr:serine hydrolase [Massilia sp. CCM 9210]MDQ1812026.1 serine hydrolase [Massilia sp. CCM 9210]
MKISLPAMIGAAAMALALLAFLAIPAQARSAQAGAGAVAKSVRHAQARPKARHKARPKARHKARPAKRRAASGARPAKRYRADSARHATLAALRSSAVLIVDPAAHKVLYEKNADAVMPIASVTKLMTALVVIEAGQDMDEVLTVADADVDRLKYSSSRLRVGTGLARSGMLHIALMSSENRAASALGRHYPGGTPAFVLAMNAKARALGMHRTRFVEPTGLSSLNVSTPEDLARLVIAAQQQALIRAYSTDPDHTIAQGRQATVYRNSNRLIASPGWHIGTQKTGYISEAGRCMVLHAKVKGRAVVMIFLDAQGKFSRARDANQVRSWLARAQR